MHIIWITISAMAQQRRVEFADFFVTKYFKPNMCFIPVGLAVCQKEKNHTLVLNGFDKTT